MWLLRILAVVMVVVVGVSIVAYAATGQRRFLQFAWRLFRYSMFFALLIFALMILERVAVIPV